MQWALLASLPVAGVLQAVIPLTGTHTAPLLILATALFGAAALAGLVRMLVDITRSRRG